MFYKASIQFGQCSLSAQQWEARRKQVLCVLMWILVLQSETVCNRLLTVRSCTALIALTLFENSALCPVVSLSAVLQES